MPNKENLDPEALQLCYLHSNWLYPKIIKRVGGSEREWSKVDHIYSPIRGNKQYTIIIK